MNPIHEFVSNFKKLFPEALIMLANENGEYVVYHDVKLNTLSESDKCAYEHLIDTTKEHNCDFWLNYMEVAQEKERKGRLF